MHRSRTFALTIAPLAFWISVVWAGQPGGAAWQDPTSIKSSSSRWTRECDWRFWTGAGQDETSSF
jgi:hypothetical protein